MTHLVSGSFAGHRPTSARRGAVAILLGLALGTAAVANDPLPATQGGSDICPRIEQNYVLCSGNLGSPSCTDLVDDVGALSQLYRGEIAKHPDWRKSLHTSIWWGCGDARLLDLRAARARRVVSAFMLRGCLEDGEGRVARGAGGDARDDARREREAVGEPPRP